MRCQSSPPSYQSGIGVRAIRMTARIAPTNAAAPMTANNFLLSFFFAALQISAAQAMQTAAATSAMPSISHSQESSCRIFMRSSSPVRQTGSCLLNLFNLNQQHHRSTHFITHSRHTHHICRRHCFLNSLNLKTTFYKWIQYLR